MATETRGPGSIMMDRVINGDMQPRTWFPQAGEVDEQAVAELAGQAAKATQDQRSMVIRKLCSLMQTADGPARNGKKISLATMAAAADRIAEMK